MGMILSAIQLAGKIRSFRVVQAENLLKSPGLDEANLKAQILQRISVDCEGKIEKFITPWGNSMNSYNFRKKVLSLVDLRLKMNDSRPKCVESAICSLYDSIMEEARKTELCIDYQAMQIRHEAAVTKAIEEKRKKEKTESLNNIRHIILNSLPNIQEDEILNVYRECIIRKILEV